MSKQKENILIQVPRGGVASATFEITPELPSKNTKDRDWNLTFVRDAMFKGDEPVRQAANDINVLFSDESKKGEAKTEYCVLMFDLKQPDDENSVWLFDNDPIQYLSDTDIEYDIHSDVSKNRNFLRMVIHNIDEYLQNIEEVGFKFVLRHVNAETGRIKFFESPDPLIGIGRGPGVPGGG